MNINQLGIMTSEEFVVAAEQLMQDEEGRAQYDELYKKMIQEMSENEYNRTKIEDRHGMLKFDASASKNKFTMNRNKTARIFESFSGASHCRKSSYLNQRLRENRNRAMQISHGIAVQGTSSTLGLEARGQSQLMKELHECSIKNLQEKNDRT